MAAMVVLGMGTIPVLGDEPVTRATIDALSPEEKATLQQRKDRFESLPLAEQERLRSLNASITAAPNSDQLLATLDRYHEWLKTLSTKQRTDLLELPMDKRIEKIKEIMEGQDRDRLRRMAEKPLPEADIDAIFNWLDEFMKRNEEEYLKKTHKDYAEKLRNMDEVSRRRSLMRSIIMRGPRNDYPLPMRDDFERLLPTLSPPTRSALESAKTAEEKQQVARQWIFHAMVSRVLPPASDEDLHKILTAMPREQRERLERKTPEEVKRELTWMHHWQNWPGREGFRGSGGPGFFGGPGFRPGSGSGNGPGGSGGGPNGSDRRGPMGSGSKRGEGGRTNPPPMPPMPMVEAVEKKVDADKKDPPAP